MLSTIRRHQDMVREILKVAQFVVVRSGDLDQIEIKDARARLDTQIEEYINLKRVKVYPVLCAVHDPLLRESALRVKARCDRMADFYQCHSMEWPMSRVAEQQALYRGVALDLIGRLRQHLVREETDFLRLAPQPEVINQSAAGHGHRERLNTSSLSYEHVAVSRRN